MDRLCLLGVARPCAGAAGPGVPRGGAPCWAACTLPARGRHGHPVGDCP